MYNSTSKLSISEAKVTLGIDDNAVLSSSTLQKAYKTQALICHPDKAGNCQDFLRLQAAYAFLKTRLASDPSQTPVQTDARPKQNHAESQSCGYTYATCSKARFSIPRSIWEHTSGVSKVTSDSESKTSPSGSDSKILQYENTPSPTCPKPSDIDNQSCPMDIDADISRTSDSDESKPYKSAATRFSKAFPPIYKFGQIRSIVFAMLASGYSQSIGVSAQDVLVFLQKHNLVVQYNKGAKIEKSRAVFFACEKASDAVLRSRIDQRLKYYPCHIIRDSRLDDKSSSNYRLSPELFQKALDEFT